MLETCGRKKNSQSLVWHDKAMSDASEHWSDALDSPDLGVTDETEAVFGYFQGLEQIICEGLEPQPTIQVRAIWDSPGKPEISYTFTSSTDFREFAS